MTQPERDSWFREVGLTSHQVYSPFKAPRPSDEDVIRAYLNRKLEAEQEIEVQTLVVTYREWADALTRMMREEFGSKGSSSRSASNRTEEGPSWVSATEQSGFEDCLQQEPDELLGLLVTAGSTTRAGGNPVRPYLPQICDYLRVKLNWNTRRDAVLALSEREQALVIVEALREKSGLTPFENLVALGTWLVKYGLDRILDTGE